MLARARCPSPPEDGGADAGVPEPHPHHGPPPRGMPCHPLCPARPLTGRRRVKQRALRPRRDGGLGSAVPPCLPAASPARRPVLPWAARGRGNGRNPAAASRPSRSASVPCACTSRRGPFTAAAPRRVQPLPCWLTPPASSLTRAAYYSCSPPLSVLACNKPAPALPGPRSGGAEGTRTPYLHNAIVALSQMSYSPNPRAAITGLRSTYGSKRVKRRQDPLHCAGSLDPPAPVRDDAGEDRHRPEGRSCSRCKG